MSTKTPKKTLCEASGHAFQPTTSPSVHVCSRSTCKLMQRLVNGQWLDVQPKSKQVKRPDMQSLSAQTLLDACGNETVSIHAAQPVQARSLRDYWQEGVQG